MCRFVHEYNTYRGQKRALDPLELVDMILMCVLGTLGLLGKKCS